MNTDQAAAQPSTYYSTAILRGLPCVGRSFMLRVSTQQRQRMWQQINDRLKRFPGAARTTGKIKDQHRTPYAANPSAQRGQQIFLAPSKRMRSATPSSNRSQTPRVASGVTSRSAIPVPPVVTPRRTLAARRMIALWIAG